MTGASNGQIDNATAPFSTGGGGGVTSLNGLTGILSLISSNGSVDITPSGLTIDLTTSGGGSLAIGDPVSGSTNYANLYVDSSGNLANGFTLPDSSGVNSIILDGRYLKDSADGYSIAWNERQAYSSAGGSTPVFDWSGTNGSSAYYYFDAANSYRLTGDGSGLTSVPFPNQYILYGSPSGGGVRIDGSTGIVVDTFNNLSYNWFDRVLTANNGSFPVLSWSGTNSGNYWFDSGNSYRLTGDGSGLYNIATLYDASGNIVISGASKLLSTAAGAPALNWSDRYLFASDGSTKVVDWHTDTTNVNSAVYWFDSINGNRLTGDGSGLTGIFPHAINTVTDLFTFSGSGTLSSDGNGNLILKTPGSPANLGFDSAGTSMVLNGAAFAINTVAALNQDGSATFVSGAATIQADGYHGSGSNLTGITQTQVNTASSVTGLTGTFAISTTLGGSVDMVNGIITSWTSAS